MDVKRYVNGFLKAALFQGGDEDIAKLERMLDQPNNQISSLINPNPAPATNLPAGLNPKRQQVVAIAQSQLGEKDQKKYYPGTVATMPNPESKQKIHWCGIFVLWVLHQAGLAMDWKWEWGKGFMAKLPETKNPQPGDLGYIDQWQHHSMIKAVDGNTIYTLDGNSKGGAVAENTRKKSDFKTFYSIAPLLGEKPV